MQQQFKHFRKRAVTLAALSLIPNSGEQELATPQLLGQATVPIEKDGSAVLTLPPLNLHEGFWLTIQNPGPKSNEPQREH